MRTPLLFVEKDPDEIPDRKVDWLFIAPAALILGLVGLASLNTVINYSFFVVFILDARY